MARVLIISIIDATLDTRTHCLRAAARLLSLSESIHLNFLLSSLSMPCSTRTSEHHSRGAPGEL